MTIQHTDVGAYALGLLEQEDRQAFEAHLADCESCAAEVAEFSPMAGLLSGIEPVEVGQDVLDETVVVDLFRQRAGARRHRFRLQAALAAAAAVVLLAGGTIAGIAVVPHQAAPLALTGQLHSAADASTGVAGTIGLVAKVWGTQVTLDLAGVRGPLECDLVAVSKTGERRVVTGWFVPSAGYGVPGHPAHLVIIGGTSIPKQELSSFEVDIVQGNTLLTIPV